MRNKLSAYILTGIILLVFSGCGDSIVSDGDDTQYTIYGMLFHNPNTDKSFCYGVFKNEGQPIPSLQADLVMTDSDSVRLLTIGGGAHLTSANSLELEPDSSYLLRADDDRGDFFLVKSLYIPDTFRVTVNQPPSRIYQTGTVVITWNPPTDTVDYFVTVEPPGENVTPYAIFPTGNTATFGPEVFTRSDGERVTGIYKFYVVAYHQTFYADAVIEDDDHIFFPYPDTGFVNNIDELEKSGRFGSAIISYYDSVEVVAEP